MISWIKKHADWIIIGFHGFVLFFALFASVTNMDISGWIFVFFVVYFSWSIYDYVKKRIRKTSISSKTTKKRV